MGLMHIERSSKPFLVLANIEETSFEGHVGEKLWTDLGLNYLNISQNAKFIAVSAKPEGLHVYSFGSNDGRYDERVM